MYVAKIKSRSSSGKIHYATLIRQSYREGKKVKSRTIAHISKLSDQQISAIKLALNLQDKMQSFPENPLECMTLRQGKRVGALWALRQVADQLGIINALGDDRPGKLALWQVMARLMGQGSRLSAVRLAEHHACCEIIGLKEGLQEDCLYDNLAWITKRQVAIEKELFRKRYGDSSPHLFLYDVTSSYLEGENNALADYGYNRDKKRGKKQLVIGLLCGPDGDPVAVRVFEGNTPDTATVSEQTRLLVEEFGIKEVTLVGDRGMLKTPQIEALPEGFTYLSAITKPQIRKLLKTGILQMELFEETVAQVETEGIRYLLRRNPKRAAELQKNRDAKRQSLEELLLEKNQYLREHPRARPATAERNLEKRIKKLKLEKWISTRLEGRKLHLEEDNKALEEMEKLDGCYVLKTDIPTEASDAQSLHDRYCDLEKVEQAFREMKTAHLEIRPVYVRKEESTRAHVFVVMLAYLIRRRLAAAWREINMTVEEGIEQLSHLSSIRVEIEGEIAYERISRPDEKSERLLKRLGVELPEMLTPNRSRVGTIRKLPERRKSQ